MEDLQPALSPTVRSPRKFLKRAIPKVIPDPSKTIIVLRAIESAAASRLDEDLLAVQFASLGYQDEILLELQRIYHEYLEKIHTAP